VLVSVGSWDFGHMNLNTSGYGIVSALLVTGLGFSCLFVPLTTVSLVNIERPQLTDATGLSSLVRQVGGSIGLTVWAVLLTRFSVTARSGLTHSITVLRPELLGRLGAVQDQVAAAGAGVTGRPMLALLDRFLTGQSTVVAYDRVFLLQAVSFLGVLPFVLLLRRGHGGGGEVHAMGE
jgi:MFS transporter, DHA2 family, multidrug resistance protein